MKRPSSLLITALTLALASQVYAQTASSSTGATVLPNTNPDVTSPTQMDENDTAVVTNVQNKISQNEVLKSFNFVIVSRDGTVTLNGTVDTQTQADAAVEAARSVDGVKEVKSNIIVKSPNSTAM